MHGHDAGVWICEGSGLGLGPTLFLQALCPDPAPRPLLVKWRQNSAPPKHFRATGTVPLIYSEGGPLAPWPYYLHLFAPQAPIAHHFELESNLQDWHLTVPILGIVVIFDRKHDAVPASLSLNWLRRNSAGHRPRSQTLAWAQAQQLPLVVAALDYDLMAEFEEDLRGRYDIAADIPIVPGPTLADARRRAGSGGIFAFTFEPQQVTLDKEFARHVMTVLYQQVVAAQRTSQEEA